MSYHFFDQHKDVIFAYNCQNELVYANSAATFFTSEFQQDFNSINSFESLFTELNGSRFSFHQLNSLSYKSINLYASKTFKVYSFEIMRDLESGYTIIQIKSTGLDKAIVESNKQYIELQEVILEIAKIFIKIDINDVSSAIQTALERIGIMVQADRAYIFNYNWEKQTASNSFEWCQKDIDPEIENLQEVPMEFFPQWVAQHKKQENLYISDVPSLHGEDQSLKEILEPQGIKSLITVPIYEHNEIYGFVGFDSVKDFRTYTQKEIGLLELFAQLLSDVKLRENLDHKLTLAKNEAENANKAKSEFLANMSHEIRTPMNGILGFIDLLSEGEKDPTKIEYLDIIKSSSENLLKIINDILDLSKIEAGKYLLKEEPVQIFQILKRTAALYELQSQSKGLNFKTQIDSSLDQIFLTDEKSIHTILNNLLSNSLKFTHSGFIELKARLINNNSLQVQITDSGIGINEEKQKQLFEPFEQGEHFLTKKYGGTGLGLSITKKIIDQMGARIEVQTVIGKGTSFTVDIPLKVAANQSKIIEQSQHKIKRPIRIISAEDVEINQILLQKVLQNEPVEIKKVYNGQELLDQLEKEEYDLILMDMQMPILNGIEATAIIRSKVAYDHIPIIAVSAFAFEENIRDILEAGANDYITKPMKKMELFDKINQWIK